MDLTVVRLEESEADPLSDSHSIPGLVDVRASVVVGSAVLLLFVAVGVGLVEDVQRASLVVTVVAPSLILLLRCLLTDI